MVLVDSTFKKRYRNFIEAEGREDGEETMREFMDLDEKAQS